MRVRRNSLKNWKHKTARRHPKGPAGGFREFWLLLLLTTRFSHRRLSGLGLGQTLLEFVYTASSINKLLLTRVEGMGERPSNRGGIPVRLPTLP